MVTRETRLVSRARLDLNSCFSGFEALRPAPVPGALSDRHPRRLPRGLTSLALSNDLGWAAAADKAPRDPRPSVPGLCEEEELQAQTPAGTPGTAR